MQKATLRARAMYEHADVIPQNVSDSLVNEALQMAKTADVIIYIGGLNKNAWQDCESTDRKSYNLPFGQDALIEKLLAINPKVIIANISGNAYAMPWVKEVPAILHASYLGTMGGASMADVISGKVNPSGKLPYSIPAKLEDCGAHSFGNVAFPGVESSTDDVVAIPGSVLNGGRNPKVEYKEDILVGYRWHDTKKVPALYPFYHGLSYTAFAYGKPSLSAKTITDGETVKVAVSVTNTGKVDGSEVVQLYIGDDKASVLRPVKELKGFKKLALKSGETAQAEFTITVDDLKFFDEKAHEWIAEEGKFTVYIGSSSTDIRGKAQFTYKK